SNNPATLLLRFPFSFAPQDKRETGTLNGAVIFLRAILKLTGHSPRRFDRRRPDESDVTIARYEVLCFGRNSGIRDRRVGLPHRLRAEVTSGDIIPRRVEVKGAGFLRP